MRRKVVFEDGETIRLEDVTTDAKVFAYKDGKIYGMVIISGAVYYLFVNVNGYSVYRGSTLAALMITANADGIEFYVHD